MARRRIPKNAGKFRVFFSNAGTFGVLNDKTGRNKVIIPCRDKRHAEEVCALLNSKDRPEVLWM
jgi:hypothetical protein